MVRDPRADILEPNPFYHSQQKIHRVHAGQQSRGSSPINNFFRVMSQTQPTLHKGSIWHFSDEEKRHLLYATAAFTLALGFMFGGRGLGGISEFGLSRWLINVLVTMPLVLMPSVQLSFFMKWSQDIAKKNGCWAEFGRIQKVFNSELC